MVTGAGSSRACPSGSEQAPSWLNLHGIRRIQKEFAAFHRSLQADNTRKPEVEVSLLNDDLTTWQLKVRSFDEDCEGGSNLNKDLHTLKARHGQDHILMEISFPDDYPTHPFFVRIVTPRMMWYTGHVTAGGSICIEALVNTGGPNGWQPSYCVESMLTLIFANMVSCEQVQIRTPSNPSGGLSGPLRIDLQRQYHYNVMQPYSMQEARSAYQRMVTTHAQTGWAKPPPPAAAPAAAPVAPAALKPPAAPAAAAAAAAPLPPAAASRPSRARALRAARSGPTAPPAPLLANGGLQAPAAAAASAAAGAAAAAAPGVAGAGAAGGSSAPARPAQLSGQKRSSIVLTLDDDDDDVVDSEITSILASSKGRSMSSGAAAAAGAISAAAAAAAAVGAAVAGVPKRIRTMLTAGGSAATTAAAQPAAATTATSAAAAAATSAPAAAAAAAKPSAPVVHVFYDDDDDAEIVMLDVPVAAGAGRPAATAAAAAKRSSSPEVELLPGPAPAAVAAAAAAKPPRARGAGALARGRSGRSANGDDDDVEVMVVDVRSASHAGGTVAAAAAVTGRGASAPAAAAAATAAAEAELQRRIAELEAQLQQERADKEEKERAAAAAAAALGSRDPRVLLNLAPPPPFWEGHEEGEDIKIVRLPWKGDPELPPSAPLLHTIGGLPGADVEAVMDSQEPEAAVDDAVAAVLWCDGDVEAAKAFLAQSRRKGGAARVVRLQTESCSLARAKLQAAESRLKVAVNVKEQQLQKQLQDEVDTVVKRFTDSGLQPDAILRIERVQNAQLWFDYYNCRAKLARDLGVAPSSSSGGGKGRGRGKAQQQQQPHKSPLNELMLFHGTSARVTTIICSTGFDAREANMHGALGAGVYFAQDSSYSMGYVNKYDPQAAAAVYGGSSGGGGGFGYMGAWMQAAFGQPLLPQPQQPWGALANPPAPKTRGRGKKGAAAAQAAAAAAAAPGMGNPSDLVPGHKWATGKVMMLCSVVLGKVSPQTVQPGQRKPPAGCNSSASNPKAVNHRGTTYAVYENAQAVPLYLLHLK